MPLMPAPRSALRHTLRASAAAAAVFGLLLGPGCATAGGGTPDRAAAARSAATLDYDALLAQVRAGDFSHLDAFRAAWLARADAGTRLQHLGDLERQAQQMYDQPLRLGAIGTAILEDYPASLLGHMANAAYYERVGDADAARHYNEFAKALATQLRNGNDGTPQSPYHVATIGDAMGLLRVSGITPLGSVYATPQAAKGKGAGLYLSVIGSRGSGKPLATTAFDISDTYYASSPDARAATSDSERQGAMQRYLGERLRQGDSAAQTYVAMNLLGSDPRYRGSAVQLLQQAVSDGNLYARLVLVQTMLGDYSDTPEEQRKPLLEAAVRELDQAVAAGSEAAMLELGRLQLSDLPFTDARGDDGKAQRRAQGIANIRKAAELDHVPAMMVLAGLYAEGSDALPKDTAQAKAWLLKAAELGDVNARLAFARYELAQKPPVLGERARTWLTELSDAGNTDAMFLLGSLHARGEQMARDLKLARKLFDKVAASDPKNPEPVNNVAWALAVSDIGELRDPRRALDIMTVMMNASEAAAHNPAYLDTWAAAHAANGKFERAIELQEAALKAAEAQQDTDTVKVLREHLEAFRRGETITEKVP